MAAIKVELVGGDDALAIFLTVLGPLLIAGAAVIAALVARKTANERQQEQLAHDSERQREQLEHDTARQELQLQHDREMRQKEHARGALDSAIELVQETNDALIDFDYEVERCEEARDADTEADQDIDTSKLGERWKVLSDKMLELHGVIARVMVRLGAKHEIPKKLDELHDVWGELENSLFSVYKGNRSEKEIEETRRKKDEARTAFSALMVACERWLRFSDTATGEPERKAKE